ncbi:MAG: shikimate dehydrogenase [Clostridia bacterium]|nr:shikimate dehydrogenase [Clostridia bacterium]
MGKKYGVIGYPIGHTMSPFIQKELFGLCGYDADYGKYAITPESLKEEFSATLRELDGFNITIPHKVAIIDCCDGLDASAAEYGAVNTILRKDGKYYGYNTDAYGFLKGLEFSGIPLCGRVMIYGFGGAARTLITESLKAGCQVFVGTTAELKAQAEPVVAELMKKSGKEIAILTNEEITESFDLFVNATPVGMYPKIGVAPITKEQVELFTYVYDIVYNPTETELLRLAKACGKICGGGLSMLVCQAQQAQIIWYGAEFSREQTAEVIKSAAEELAKEFSK